LNFPKISKKYLLEKSLKYRKSKKILAPQVSTSGEEESRLKMMKTFSIRERSVQLKNDVKRSARGRKNSKLWKRRRWKRRRNKNLNSKTTSLCAQILENLKKVGAQLWPAKTNQGASAIHVIMKILTKLLLKSGA